MATDQLKNPAIVSAQYTFTTVPVFPAETLKNAAYSTSAAHALGYDKQHTVFGLGVQQADGTDVVNATTKLYHMMYPGRILSFSVHIIDAPTGGNKQYTVDLQKKSAGASSWTSLLSSVITISSADTDDDVEDGTLISDPSLTGEDALRVVVTATGTTGSQGQGFIASARVAEAPADVTLM